jgi:hypothetical protein
VCVCVCVHMCLGRSRHVVLKYPWVDIYITQKFSLVFWCLLHSSEDINITDKDNCFIIKVLLYSPELLWIYLSNNFINSFLRYF